MDKSPVDKKFYNPETPGMTKIGLSTGFSFNPTERFAIDVAFLAILGTGTDGSYEYINVISKQKETFSGSYKSTAYAPSIGFSYKF